MLSEKTIRYITITICLLVTSLTQIGQCDPPQIPQELEEASQVSPLRPEEIIELEEIKKAMPPKFRLQIFENEPFPEPAVKKANSKAVPLNPYPKNPYPDKASQNEKRTMKLQPMPKEPFPDFAMPKAGSVDLQSMTNNLRSTARSLENLAAIMEQQRDYELADFYREQANQLWHMARGLLQNHQEARPTLRWQAN